jgi:hypothetical protein
LKILTVADGKIDSFKLPKLRGADRVWLRFSREANQLLIAVTSETKCSAYSLEDLGGNWSFSGSPIQIDGQCFGISEFNQGRAFLVCATNLPANKKVDLVDSATGSTVWDYGFDSKILDVKLVISGWLPKGNFVLILPNRESILVVDDGAKLNHYKTNFSLTNQLISVDLDFFMNQLQTNSLGLKAVNRESRIDSVGKDIPRDSVRNAFNKLRGESDRLLECHREAFVHFALPERNVWVRGQGTISYFVMNGRNGNLCLPLLNKSEGCFPLAISESNAIFAVVYPEPSKNSLFSRSSNQLPKAVLVQYDFGAKGLDQLVRSSSPFQDKTPMQGLSASPIPPGIVSKESKVQVNFLIETEYPEDKETVVEIEYSSDVSGRRNDKRRVAFGTQVTVFEAIEFDNSHCKFYFNAGPAFEILLVNAVLVPGEVTELGRLKLKPAAYRRSPIAVFGAIKNSRTQPLKNVEVTASWKDGKPFEKNEVVSKKTTTDMDGNYRLDRVGLNDLKILVSQNGFLPEFKQFDSRYVSKEQVEYNATLSNAPRIKLRYVISEHRRDRFVGKMVEMGSTETVIENSNYRLKSIQGLQKRFNEFVLKTELRIVIDKTGLHLRGNVPVWTAEGLDFDSITEVGTICNNETLLTVGKTLLIRGFDPDKKKNFSDYCVKVLVESIDEVDNELPGVSSKTEVEKKLLPLNSEVIDP